MEKILKSLTIEQAMEWDRATDKWVFIDDTILAPANLKATDKRVEAIEDEFRARIEYLVLESMGLKHLSEKATQ